MNRRTPAGTKKESVPRNSDFSRDCLGVASPVTVQWTVTLGVTRDGCGFVTRMDGEGQRKFTPVSCSCDVFISYLVQYSTLPTTEVDLCPPFPSGVTGSLYYRFQTSSSPSFGIRKESLHQTGRFRVVERSDQIYGEEGPSGGLDKPM